MGYQVRDYCYSTAVEAVNAMAAAQVGSVVVSGSVAYAVDVSATTANSISLVLTPVAGGTAVLSTVAVTPQPCGLIEAEDALAAAWGVAAVWLILAAFLFMGKGAKTS